MPIRRWHGWAAICKVCGREVDLTGDGIVAWKERSHVKDSVLDNYIGNLEEAITEACGCKRKKTL